MVDFISPVAQRMQRQVRLSCLEIALALLMLITFSVWQYTALPLELPPDSKRQLQQGYQPPSVLKPHPLFSQLQLIRELGGNFHAPDGRSYSALSEQAPDFQLRRIYFQDGVAKLTWVLKSALDMQKITRLEASGWQIESADLHEESSFPPYSWALDLELSLKPEGAQGNGEEQHEE